MENSQNIWNHHLEPRFCFSKNDQAVVYDFRGTIFLGVKQILTQGFRPLWFTLHSEFRIFVVLSRNLLSYSDTSGVSSLDVVWITHRSRSNTPRRPLFFPTKQPSSWLIGPVSQKRTKRGQLKAKAFPRWWSCRIVWKYLAIFQLIWSPI